ncbi:MAG: D-alanine--D-alanine ligase [Candidatus Moraniibacteriota bacterium]|nr:MAG: D-alanine--D-alanine ligase [Candidatus Moranbacteria bacterium]
MKQKIRVGILFGGKSVEHEVSLMSAQNVVEALDRNKYEPVLIGIDKKGRWHIQEELITLSTRLTKRVKKVREKDTQSVAFIPAHQGVLQPLNQSKGQKTFPKVDVVFPILHGPMGEDGTVQGLLKLAGIPFVGADVLGSAIGMDKDVMKRLLKEAGLSVAPFLVFRQGEHMNYTSIVRKLGKMLFVKPANAGSSVGVSKVKGLGDFQKAVALAFRYDQKIIIEQAILGREIECAILGNDTLIASVPGEVIPTHEFYDYEAKYLDEDGAQLEVPAGLSKQQITTVQALAKRTFKILECSGLARVDFFLTPRGKWYVNEINTLPGFTNISMYPRMFAASGLSYDKLIDRLLQLALERFQTAKKLETSRV